MDIYGRHRYIDFALESPESKIAIEIDGETYHNPSKVSENKYADDLLKQNSLIYDNWKVYRWIYSQLEKQPEKVKDELITFLGTSPMFKAFEADLPVQMGQTIELRDYQQEATENLQKMREDGKTIALLYYATGVGKTITAATDAKAVGGRTLFLVNALKLASQAKETFAKVWPEATLGEYTGSQKDMTQTVIFATVRSISKDLEKFSPTDFDYLIVDECHHAAANTYQKIFTYEDRKAHGMIAEKPNSIYQKGGYTKKDVEKNILSNPFKRFEDMRFLMRCKDVETVEVNPIIFRKLTREDWLHIVDVCDKSLEKYYMRFKK